MPLLSRKDLLAIAAVIDVALHARDAPVSAQALALRHNLPPRHLEPVLQALVRAGIFDGVRGPRGGYRLSRERRRITVSDVLRAAGGDDDSTNVPRSRVLSEVILPAIADAERAFMAALGRLTVDDLARRAEALGERGGR